MKHVILVRHAKAVKAKKESEDLNRGLKKSGKKEATEMAKALKKTGFIPDLILTSPAERAAKTAQLFAEKLKQDSTQIIKNQELYTANSGESLLKLVKELDNQINTVMMVGHEPMLSDFASQLVSSFNYQLPSPGVIVIQFNKNSWKQITRRSGVIKSVQFAMTKTQRTHYAQSVYNALQNNIMTNLLSLFDELKHQPSKKLSKLIKKQSKELARTFLASEKDRSIQIESEIDAALNELPQKEVAEPEPAKNPAQPGVVGEKPKETRMTSPPALKGSKVTPHPVPVNNSIETENPANVQPQSE